MNEYNNDKPFTAELFFVNTPEPGSQRWDPRKYGLKYTQGQLDRIKDVREQLPGEVDEKTVRAFLLTVAAASMQGVMQIWSEMLKSVPVFTRQGFTLYWEAIKSAKDTFNEMRCILWLILHEERNLPESVFPDLFWQEPPYFEAELQMKLSVINNTAGTAAIEEIRKHLGQSE